MTNETRQSDEAIIMQKKLYSAPELTDYGSVSQLTLGGGFDGNDGNTKCAGNAGTSEECGS